MKNGMDLKRVWAVLILAVAVVPMVFAGDVITRDAKRLPLTARNFINRYFTKPQVAHIKIESGLLGGKKYEVLLTCRAEIEFDGDGQWTEVDCKRASVPDALVPIAVRRYVAEMFPQEIITQIERKPRGGIELELANGYSLEFNGKGELIDMDD